MIKKLLLICLSFMSLTAARATVFPKVIIPGDFADPSILRDGKDYYMTHSPFIYKPGFLIWHSSDLSTWTPVARALDDWEGSAMAPDLVKHKGKYYIYFPSAGTVFVTMAEKITGPWSKPVDLKVAGIDPGHIVDQNGNRYLFVNEGEMVKLSEDGMKAISEKKKVYDGWNIPSNWVTEGKYLESPKLLYKDGYYYMVSAEGGTAGPPTSHMVISARSKSVYGPWENSPYNPAVHTYSDTERWWSKGHGTLVDDTDGNWWIVYHAYANNNHAMGRQTLIEPIEWTSDGWFKPAGLNRELPVSHTAEIPISDNFRDKELGWQWMLWDKYRPQSIECGEGSLSLKASGHTPGDATVLLTTAMHPNYNVTADIELVSSARGGLLLFYSDKAYAGVLADKKNLYLYEGKDKYTIVPNKYGKFFKLKLINQGNKMRAFVSKNGTDWTQIGGKINVAHMNHNQYKKFFALRPALVSLGKGTVKFSDFQYSDNVPEEKSLTSYVMVFHNDSTHSLHMAISRDGYSFTALNDGNPIMCGDSIAVQHGIRDPHIYRGPDGAFYVAMTDLHVFAKRDGYRNTEWERDGFGWGNNKDLVLLKSWDLIEWNRTNIHFDKMSVGLQNIGCAWAPETIYDPVKEKMMIYFTMRYGNERNKLYYVYVNDNFSEVETMPNLLFEYPDFKSSAIDADITFSPTDGLFHMFYVAHDNVPGIKQATAPSPTGPWTFDPKWYDYEPKACEAPTVWKRAGQNKWVLMYDVYSITPHNFGFAETSDFKSFEYLGKFNDGVMKATNFAAPKHGAIVGITESEADNLEKYWKENPQPYVRRQNTAGLQSTTDHE